MDRSGQHRRCMLSGLSTGTGSLVAFSDLHLVCRLAMPLLGIEGPALMAGLSATGCCLGGGIVAGRAGRAA